MAKIISLPDGVEFDANEGETLLESALRADLAADPCLRWPSEMLDLPNLGA